MANKELDQMRSILSNLDSEATSKPQPSKTMNGGSAKIDGANPTSPSTNPATRREEYSNYIKTLNKDQQQSLYNEVLWYKNQGMSNDQIYDKVLWNSTTTPDIKEAPTTTGVDLTIKGNFDLYNPVDWQSQPEMMQQYYVQANNDIKSSRRALSKLMLQQDALNSKSGNVEQVTTLIDAIENAYDRGVFDTETIANTLWVPVETVSLIQQGKANELVTLNQEFVEDELKSFYRAEEDYNTNLQRTMEDFNLAKTNLDRQYNSAMQTLKRNLFDDKRAASVGSAVAWISGSEYAVRVIEAKHQQNMDDLEWNYLYSSIQQKYSYTRAIEDYNKNIQRLSEDFDDSLKDIQASVLQQFQEIDNKIGLTTEQLAKAYGTLQQNVLAAKSTATTNYLEALANNENGLANAIANTYWLDTGSIWQPSMRTERNNNPTAMTTDVAKTLWMVEWVDYIVWDKFQDSNLHTARLLWDPIETTIRAFDNAAAKGIWIFYTQWWKQRWSHTAMTNEQWKKLTDEQKRNVIYAMLQREWGNMNNMSYYYEQGTTAWWTQWTTTEWWTTTGWKTEWYDPAKAPLYESYLQQKYTNIKDFISDPSFQAEALAYQGAKTPTIISWIQDSLNTMVEFRNRYNELSPKEKEVISLIPAADIQNWWFRQNTALTDKQKNVLNLYNQIKAQLFIDWIVDSKKKWASYWNLSDAEWNKISNAQTNLNVNAPSYVNYNVDKMIRDLVWDIEALWWTADTKSWYSYQPKKWKKIPKIYEASSLINSWASSEFNTTWWINLASTWSTNTWTFQIPFTNMK